MISFCLMSLYFILLYFIIISYKPVCFLIRERKRESLSKKESREQLRGVNGGETIIRTDYVRKESTKGEKKQVSGCLEQGED